MAIYTTNAKSGPYAADGSQMVFPFDFPVTELSDVWVYKDGARVESGFSVAKGTVTFSVAPEKGSRIVLLRRVKATQETDIQNNTAFYPEILENAFDKLTMLCQQLAEELSRCISVDPTNPVSPAETLALLFKAQEVAAKQAERAETAANAAMVNGETQVQRAKHFADQAKESAAKAEIGYDELGESAVITPGVAFSEDQIIYDEV